MADTIAGIVEVTPAQTVIVVGAAPTAADLEPGHLALGLPSSSSHALVGAWWAPQWQRLASGRSTGAASAAGIRPASSGSWWRWRSRRCWASARPG